jgi:hypothetical protein
MLRSTAPRLAGLAAALLLSLALVPSVLAKEGVEATLAAPISPDAEPGDTVTVFFTLSRITDAGTSPLRGSAASFRLFGPTGVMTQADGIETSTPGTYRASIEIPAGGATRAEFAIRGDTTITWPFSGVLVAAKVPTAVDPGTFQPPVVTRPDVIVPKYATEPVPLPAGSSPTPSAPLLIDPRLVGGAVLALLLGIAGGVALRRRHLRPTTA